MPAPAPGVGADSRRGPASAYVTPARRGNSDAGRAPAGFRARRLPEVIVHEAPLAGLTTFGVGGPAEILAHPRTPDELASLVRRACETGTRVRILGAGSNVLVADEGVRGMVVRLAAPPLRDLARVGAETVQCGGGARLSRLVSALADWGLSGAEGLAGIPGTVGGALVMNAGTAMGEIGPLVRRVWALGPDGAAVCLTAGDCRFDYRRSALGRFIVLGAELWLASGDAAAIRTRIEECRADRGRAQPRGARTAGCVFKNPPGERAGRLLEEAGLKGLRRGGARVSPVHANFIEAGPGARAADVKALVDEMRRRVREESGFELEPELELWGFEGEHGDV